MAREVGVSNITLWELIEDNLGGTPKYLEPFKLPWAVNLETEDEYAEGEYYGDNVIEKSEKRITKSNITLEVSSNTPPQLDAKITGKGYKNGKSGTKVGQNQPRYALAYSILMDDNTERRRVLHNITLQRTTQTNKTLEGEGEGQTYTYEGVAIPLKSTKDIHLIMDEKELEALEEEEKTAALAEWEKFFEQPILLDGTSTVQKVMQSSMRSVNEEDKIKKSNK